MSIELAEKLLTFPPEERERRAELLGAFAELVARKPLGELQRARAELERLPSAPTAYRDGPGDATQAALLRAWTKNLVRVFEDRARLARECLPARIVREGLGVSRQRLHQLVKGGRLLAVVTRGRRASLYPSWQFTADGRIVGGLDEVIRAGREAEMDAETLHFFMVEPNDRLGGEAPAVPLARGEVGRVVEVLRSAGLGPF